MIEKVTEKVTKRLPKRLPKMHDRLPKGYEKVTARSAASGPGAGSIRIEQRVTNVYV